MKLVACTLLAYGVPVGAQKAASLDSVNSLIDSLPSPASVMSSADGMANSVSSASATLARDRQQLSNLSADIDKLNQQINDTSLKDATILLDFKNGYFCNECHRSMSEFPSPAAFWAHIQENASGGRKAIPATQDQINAKKKELDDAMNQLLAAKQTQVVAEQELKRKIEAETARIQNGLLLWDSFVSFAYDCSDYERTARLNAIDLAIDNANLLRQKASNIVIHESAKNHPDPVLFPIALTMKASWDQRIIDLTKQRAAVLSAASTDYGVLDQAKSNQYSAIASALAKLPGMPVYVSLPAVNLTFGRVSLVTDPTSINVTFNLWNGVGIGLSASQTSTSTEVATFIQLTSAFKVGVASVTRMTVNGITASYNPVFPVISRDPLSRDPITRLPLP